MKLTDFQKKVLRVTSQIPPGEVRSYKWVAEKAGNPKAYRAVGRALKNNPYPIAIPCHRVVKSDNSLGGYIFGEKRKKELLDKEKHIKEILDLTRSNEDRTYGM